MSALSPSWDTLLPALVGLLAGSILSIRGRGRILGGGVVLGLALAGLRLAVTNTGGYAELPRSFMVVTAVLVLASVTLVAAGLRTAYAAVPAPLVPPLPRSGSAVLPWLHAGAALLTLLVPSLHLFLAALLVAAVAGWFDPGRGWFRPVPLLAILLLLASWYFLARVAGPATLQLGGMGEAPFSTAFELAAAAGLLVLAWVLLGLVPFHQMQRGCLTPILGGALLVRLVAIAVPAGLAHWQPVAYPVVLLTTLVAAAWPRRTLAGLAVACTGLLSGARGAGWAGLLLLGSMLALEAEAAWRRQGRDLRGAGRVLRAVAGAAGGLALVPALAGGLAAETVYTAVIALLAAIALARDCTR